MPVISKEELQGAHVDALDLAAFTSDVAGDVTPREGAAYPNIRKLVGEFEAVIAEQVIQEETATASATAAEGFAERAEDAAETLTVLTEPPEAAGVADAYASVAASPFPNLESVPNLMFFDATTISSRGVATTITGLVAGAKFTRYSYYHPNRDEIADPAEECRVQFSQNSGSSSGVSDFFVITPYVFERNVITIAANGNWRPGIYLNKGRGGYILDFCFTGEVNYTNEELQNLVNNWWLDFVLGGKGDMLTRDDMTRGPSQYLTKAVGGGSSSTAPIDGKTYAQKDGDYVAIRDPARAFTAKGWLADRSAMMFDPYSDLKTVSPYGSTTAPTTGLTVAGQTITLSGAGSGSNGFYRFGPERAPAGSRFVALQGVFRRGTGTQPLKIDLRNRSGTVLNTFSLNAAAQTIVSSIGGTDTLTPGSNFDLTSTGNGARLTVLIDNLKKTAFVIPQWKDTAGGSGLLEQKYTAGNNQTWSATNYGGEIREIRLFTDAAETGTWTVREPFMFTPTIAILGSSLCAGTDGTNASSDGGFTPYPGYTNENRGWDFAYLFAREMGKMALNFAVASGGTAGCAAQLDTVKRCGVSMIFSDAGGLINDISNLTFNSDAAANVGLALDELEEMIDDTPGILWVVTEVPPRAATSTTAGQTNYNSQVATANATLANWDAESGHAASKPNVLLVRIYDRLYDGGNGAGAPDLKKAPDGTHWNDLFRREVTLGVRNRLATAYIGVEMSHFSWS